MFTTTKLIFKKMQKRNKHNNDSDETGDSETESEKSGDYNRKNRRNVKEKTSHRKKTGKTYVERKRDERVDSDRDVRLQISKGRKKYELVDSDREERYRTSYDKKEERKRHERVDSDREERLQILQDRNEAARTQYGLVDSDREEKFRMLHEKKNKTRKKFERVDREDNDREKRLRITNDKKETGNRRHELEGSDRYERLRMSNEEKETGRKSHERGHRVKQNQISNVKHYHSTHSDNERLQENKAYSSKEEIRNPPSKLLVGSSEYSGKKYASEDERLHGRRNQDRRSGRKYHRNSLRRQIHPPQVSSYGERNTNKDAAKQTQDMTKYGNKENIKMANVEDNNRVKGKSAEKQLKEHEAAISAPLSGEESNILRKSRALSKGKPSDQILYESYRRLRLRNSAAKSKESKYNLTSKHTMKQHPQEYVTKNSNGYSSEENRKYKQGKTTKLSDAKSKELFEVNESKTTKKVNGFRNYSSTSAESSDRFPNLINSPSHSNPNDYNAVQQRVISQFRDRFSLDDTLNIFPKTFNTSSVNRTIENIDIPKEQINFNRKNLGYRSSRADEFQKAAQKLGYSKTGFSTNQMFQRSNRAYQSNPNMNDKADKILGPPAGYKLIVEDLPARPFNRNDRIYRSNPDILLDTTKFRQGQFLSNSQVPLVISDVEFHDINQTTYLTNNSNNGYDSPIMKGRYIKEEENMIHHNYKQLDTSSHITQPLQLTTKVVDVSNNVPLPYDFNPSEQNQYMTNKVHDEQPKVHVQREALTSQLETEIARKLPVPLLYPKMEDISQLNYYHGGLSREEAENLLLSYTVTDGSFLVRKKTSSDAGELVLSMLVGIEVKHFVISLTAEGLYHIGHTAEVAFPSLRKLIDYLIDVGVDNKYKLTTPVDLSFPPPPPPLPGALHDQWSVPSHLIKLDVELGRGRFGVVYRAVLDNSTVVAVKTLKEVTYAAMGDVDNFLCEIEMLKHIRHPRLTKLLGTTKLSDGQAGIIMEFLVNGNLLEYLLDVRTWVLTLSDKKKAAFGIQVAEGMQYLEGQRVIHRDLAARNILLSVDMTAKIADFGLSRFLKENVDMIPDLTHKPMRWMALESLLRNQFSTRSDVWSYGILLLEIYSLGEPPYSNLSDEAVIPSLEAGVRANKPSNCSDKIYRELMTRCWYENPNDRPSFQQILQIWKVLGY